MACSCWDGRWEICQFCLACGQRGRGWILQQVKMAAPDSDMEVEPDSPDQCPFCLELIGENGLMCHDCHMERVQVACEHLYVRYGCTEETLLSAYASESARDPSNERRLRAAYETIAGHALPECGEGWSTGALTRTGVQRPAD